VIHLSNKYLKLDTVSVKVWAYFSNVQSYKANRKCVCEVPAERSQCASFIVLAHNKALSRRCEHPPSHFLNVFLKKKEIVFLAIHSAGNSIRKEHEPDLNLSHLNAVHDSVYT